MTPEAPRRWSGLPSLLLLVGLLSLPALWAVWSRWQRRDMADNERAATSVLATIASFEAEFRGTDRDGNGTQDYWTGDVAGLFGYRLPGSSFGVAYEDIARADPSRPDAAPFRGYWFVPLKIGGHPLDPAVFAYGAYPARPGVSGRRVFIINQNQTIYAKDELEAPPQRWPPEPELRSWSIPGG